MTKTGAGKTEIGKTAAGRVRSRLRRMALLLAMLLLPGLTACGNGTQGTGGSTEEELPLIRVSLLVSSEAQPDLLLVQDRLNELVSPQIGARIELVPIRMADSSSIYLQMTAEGEAPDLMLLLSGDGQLPTFVEHHMVLPLDEYLEAYGHDLANAFSDALPGGVFQGLQYGIPQETNMIGTSAKGFNLSKSICDAYGIDPEAIETAEDLEAVFDLIHEKEPQLTILMPETTSSAIADALIPWYDNLTVGPGVLTESEDGGLTVVCREEQSAVREALETVHRWYEKGFIPRNVNTTDENGAEMLAAGKCFAAESASIGAELGGTDYYSVILTEELPLMTTGQTDLFLWTVSDQCEYPQLAVAFLNVCCRDSRVSNLLRFGISGVHYDMLSNGTLDTSKNAGYSNPWIQFGKADDICFTAEAYAVSTKTAGVTVPNQLRILYRNWENEISPAYGFLFDPSELSLQVAACQEVDDTYYYPLYNGTVDPDTELDKYIQALYEAGMEQVLAEKQHQLDAWLAEQK